MKRDRPSAASIFATLSLVALAACGGDATEPTGSALEAAVAQPAAAATAPASTVPDAIPYTIEYRPVPVPGDDTWPALQAHSLAVDDNGTWYVVGGRHTQGLHTFSTTGNNFPVSNANKFLWLHDPSRQVALKLVDLTAIDRALGDPLMSTNQQSHYDRTSGYWYILGGYGMDTSTNEMVTFDTLIRIPLKEVSAIANDQSLNADDKQSQIVATFESISDPLFKVTGGDLAVTSSGYFVIVFGQLFDGLYNPFGNGGFTQVYTEAVRYFTLQNGSFAVNQQGSLTSSDTDHPYHRRDLPVVEDIDPTTGNPRIAAFGGVFPPGIIGGYDYPVYVTEAFGQLQARPDHTVQHRFSAYECPTVVVWDAGDNTVYHTFFGGISHHYFHFDAEQLSVYTDVDAQGRNDGLPFIPDISTLLQRSDGTYAEYIAPQPIPPASSGTPTRNLNGSSVKFIPEPDLGDLMDERGVVQLQNWTTGQSAQIGFVYGGINADFPLPKVPNMGTQATNALYQVWLTNTPWDGIPASEGKEAVGVFSHGDPSVQGDGAQ